MTIKFLTIPANIARSFWLKITIFLLEWMETFYLVFGQKGIALLNQRIGRIVPNHNLNVFFAFYYLIAPLKAVENATSSTTVKHLSHSDIENLLLPLPPVEEQEAIASILSDMDTEIDVLEEKLAKVKNFKKGMMQELLTGRIRLI